MKKEKELQEDKRNLVADQVKFLETNYDNKKGWINGQEDEDKFSEMEKDLLSFDDKIAKSNALFEKQALLTEENLKRKDDKLDGSVEEHQENYSKVFQKYLLVGRENLTGDEYKALSGGYKKGTSPQTTADGAGGFNIPESLFPSVNQAREAIGSVRQAASVIKTKSGAQIKYPKLDDTAALAELQTEGSALTVVDMTFTEVPLDAYTLGSLLKLTVQLEADQGTDLMQTVNNSMGLRVARKENAFFTTGTGSSQPQGVATAATYGHQTATKDVIITDDVYDLIHSVDPEYRYNPKSGFMFHDNTLKTLKKLSVGSGDDRPLWVPSFRDGEPDTIDGRQYWINQSMVSDITAGGKIMLYGDFAQFVIRDAGGLNMIRLTERYMDALTVGYIIYNRVDSALVGPAGCIKHMHNVAT